MRRENKREMTLKEVEEAHEHEGLKVVIITDHLTGSIAIALD